MRIRSFECWWYRSGRPLGWTNKEARAEAERLTLLKYLSATMRRPSVWAGMMGCVVEHRCVLRRYLRPTTTAKPCLLVQCTNTMSNTVLYLTSTSPLAGLAILFIIHLFFVMVSMIENSCEYVLFWWQMIGSRKGTGRRLLLWYQIDNEGFSLTYHRIGMPVVH